MRIASATAGAVLFLVARSASAQELPFACEAGVVLAPPEAQTVVTRGCAAARTKASSGRFRIGVLTMGPKIVVTVARTADASGVDRTARGEATTMDDAARVAETAIDALVGGPKTASPSPPPPSTSAQPAPARTPSASAQPAPGRPPSTAAQNAPVTKPSSPSAARPVAAGDSHVYVAPPDAEPVPAAEPSQVPAASSSPPTAARRSRQPDADDEVKRSDSTVHVSLRLPDGVRLLRSGDGSGDWKPVCAKSCEVDLPRDASYRVVDRYGNALKGFRLEPNGRERMSVDVSTRSTPIDVLGVVGLAGGTVAFIGGESKGQGGIALLGVLVAVGGAAALIANGATVSQDAPSHPDDAPRQRDHFGNARGSAFSGTLLSGSF